MFMKRLMVTLLAVTGMFGMVNLVRAQGEIYGPVLDWWIAGERLQEQGDFAGAQLAYEEAFRVSQELPDPHLRDCAETGSLAHIRAMIAVQEYLNVHGNSPQAVAQARTMADREFEAMWDTRPNLATSCP
jgi:hypothetical protein